MRNTIDPYASWRDEKNNLEYLFYKTADHSSSVSIKSESWTTELMHSEAGAFSETIYLYEDVVKYAVDSPSSFLSLGLGMGYVEMLSCSYMLKNFPKKSYKIFSFEKDNNLKNFFHRFLYDQEIPSLFLETYHSILELFCTHYGLKSVDLKNALKNVNFYAEYNLETKVEAPINGLFFDAFSIGTSPELWTDELIRKILSSCDGHAAFATYAARTHLKKLLLEYDFNLEKKVGYGGKKESTFAWK